MFSLKQEHIHRRPQKYKQNKDCRNRGLLTKVQVGLHLGTISEIPVEPTSTCNMQFRAENGGEGNFQKGSKTMRPYVKKI